MEIEEINWPFGCLFFLSDSSNLKCQLAFSQKTLQETFFWFRDVGLEFGPHTYILRVYSRHFSGNLRGFLFPVGWCWFFRTFVENLQKAGQRVGVGWTLYLGTPSLLPDTIYGPLSDLWEPSRVTLTHIPQCLLPTNSRAGSLKPNILVMCQRILTVELEYILLNILPNRT